MGGAGDSEYDVFVDRHGRRHTSQEDYEARRAIFQEKKAYIEAWNSRAGTEEHSHRCVLFAVFRTAYGFTLLP